MRLRNILLLTFFLLLIQAVTAQAPIRYELNLDDIEHHELHVTIEFPAVSQQVLQVRMPRSSPGRYAVHNFAKNVYDVRAYDGEGEALPVYRATPHQWNVAGHDGRVKFEYTLYGNHGDGTYTGIDNRKLHLNMPATFPYGAGMQGRPVELHLDLSDHPGWDVATQLQPLPGGGYGAPDYYYFYDSPTLAGEIDLRRWTSTSGDREYTIEIAMMHEGTDEELDTYAEWVKTVVEEEKAVFGELPEFDYRRYTFLCSYNPWIYGDGMEHRNSTVCSSQGNLADDAGRLIGTIAHEFFHAWNVERIRPQSLEPFDFDRANMSEALWFAEGFTSYYDDLILCRTGIRTPDEYAQGLTGLLSYVLNFPGRRHRSPVEMSYSAPFVDAATAVDEDNFSNTFISYYSYGAVLGLTLDLTLRTQYEGLTLDDFMRRVWQEQGKTEVPYRLPDLERLLAELTGHKAFAKSFFQESIYGSALPNMAELLEPFGISLQLARPGQAGFPILELSYSPDGAVVTEIILETNPLFEAGVTKGSRLLTLAGKAVDSKEAFGKISQELKIGEEYSVTFVQNGIEQSGTFTAAQDPALEVTLNERASQKQQERRREWLKH
jgi:predicted metalloprotease with PDZ domain